MASEEAARDEEEEEDGMQQRLLAQWQLQAQQEGPPHRRPLCKRCARPLSVCVCGLLPPTGSCLLRLNDPPINSTDIRVLILQTRSEAQSRSHITRTVPLLQLLFPHPDDLVVVTSGGGGGGRGGGGNGVTNQPVVEGGDPKKGGNGSSSSNSTNAVVAALVRESGGRALVFYPGPDAVGLGEGVRRLLLLNDGGNGGGRDDDAGDGGGGGSLPSSPPPPLLLVFVDGTWEGARRLYHRTPCLHPLPKVALPAYADPSARSGPTAPAPTPAPTPADEAAAAAAAATLGPPPPPPFPQPPSHGTNQNKEEEDEELASWLRAPPLFTIRKEPAPLLGRGGRSTAEAVALALALLPAPTPEAAGRWRAAARAIRALVAGANAMQVASMDPSTVQHRRERPGYVEDLYGWRENGGVGEGDG